MSQKDLDPDISALFNSAKELVDKKRNWGQIGYDCDPCDPLLPIKQPKAFYGKNNSLFRDLIANLLDFVQDPKHDLLMLKGPFGCGKTIVAKIFEEYSQNLGLNASYQDAAASFSEITTQFKEGMLIDTNQVLEEDVILVDNAFYLYKSLPKLLSLESSDKRTPKIIAIMNSTEFEVYRRWCIQLGDKSYQNVLSMPHLSSTNINDLISKRLHVCFGKQSVPIAIENITLEIALLSQGNPGLAVRILEETLRFSRSLEDLRLSFGIDPNASNDFPPSKSPILREILVREIQNDFLPPNKKEYIRHKNLTQIMNKTKSTISHHLSDLVNRNIIYEQSTTHDKREKVYRPNKTIFGIIEYLAFELPFIEDNLLTLEGMDREK